MIEQLISLKHLEDALLRVKDNTGSGSSIPNPLPIEMGGTGNADGYIRTGQKKGTVAGQYSTIEGFSNTASGNYSHAEGNNTEASGNYSHAEGNNTEASSYCHAEGNGTIARGYASHAEGYETTASGNYSHAEGNNTTASGWCAHAEGTRTKAIKDYSHAEGYETTASGYNSHSSGKGTIASKQSQFVVGEYNKESTGGSSNEIDNTAVFIVGKGTSRVSRANAFRVGFTSVWGGTYQSSGADYAEMFEWEDGNPNQEDRVGRFVTMRKGKIAYASPSDRILGITSANPSICGDAYDDQWAGMYLTDVFGRPVYEEVTIPAEYLDDVLVCEEHVTTCQKINPMYDSSRVYTGRSSRHEWSPVGIIGKIVMFQDGTLSEDDFVTVGEGGIATKSQTETNCIVMNVINNEHVRVFLFPSFK